MVLSVPRVGDTIYVDDTDVVHQTYVQVGLATIREVTVRDGRAWVAVVEVGGGYWSWEYLAPMQDALRECFGSVRAGKYVLGPENT